MRNKKKRQMNSGLDENLKNEIIDSLDLDSLTSFEQEAIIADLEEQIIKQVNGIILDRLTSIEKEELETMTDEAEMADFVQRAIPDLEEVKQEAARWVVKNWRKELF